MKIPLGGDVRLDLALLLETRLLIQANSGAGKSWALRRILEQSHGKVQHLILDVEDEFSTLREKYDYVLARQGGDCPVEVRSAGLLARRLLDLRAPAVVNLYELKHHDRLRYVRLFLEALVEAPKENRQTLVVLDECHYWCPQAGEAESASAVIDIATRGRKRGLCCLIATQRISKLHKDVAAECKNKMVGNTTLDIDAKRAADDLGFAGRDERLELRNLDTGEWFGFGPALSREVVRFTVGPVETSHPRVGRRSLAPLPPTAQIRALLAKLADLPKEAEQEARTVEELRKEVRGLRAELRAKPRPQIDSGAVEAAVTRAVENERRKISKVLRRTHATVRAGISQVSKACDLLEPLSLDTHPVSPLTIAARPDQSFRAPKIPPPLPPEAPVNGDLPGPQQRILDAVAWLHSLNQDAPEQVAAAFLAGYTVDGGGYNNPRGALRTAGLVEYVGGDRIRLTEEGRQKARWPHEPLTAEELQRRVLDRLPGPPRKILGVLIAAYPEALTNAECAERAGYTAEGGGYNNPRGRLQSLGLIDYPESGKVRALPVLFLES